MTLLDRFRSSSPQQHADPAVRLAHVEELPLDAREAIAAAARGDQDPRVRKAAVEKLLDPATLGEIARSDSDEGVRAAALAMLRDIALEAFEGLGEQDSLSALGALSDQKVIGQIARSAEREDVALKAVSALTDVRALGTVARHAVNEAARRAALDTLRERGAAQEIMAVAMHSEHRDTGLAAVEWFDDTATLEQIARQSRNKSAAKRARTRVHEAQALAEAEARAAEEARRELAAEAARMAAAQAAATVENSVSVTDENAPIIDAPVEPRTEIPTEADASTENSLPDAVSAVESADAAAAAVAADAEPAENAGPSSEAEPAQDGSADSALDASTAAPVESAQDGSDPAAAESAEAKARSRREAIGKLRHLASRVELLLGRDDVSLKAAERALRDLRGTLDELPEPGPDLEEIVPRLKQALSALTPRVQELREATEWRQWANVGIQEQLCEKMEALASVEDPEVIARTVRELQREWRAAADVPRAKADALWRRFKAAHDAVWPRCEAHFAAEAEMRAANLARKTELCEKAEALADSTNWIQTAEAIKALQAEWKTIGPVSRGHEKAIWDRFRSACDRFFTRRHEDLAQRKKVWAENLAKKEALCDKAEALAESTDWEAAAATIRQLQAEWKTIGPVKKSRSEAIWQRFRSACDKFFQRYSTRHDTARAERVAAREALCAELEALAGGEAGPEPPADLLSSVRAVRQRWNQEVASRGIDPDTARQLDERFHRALAAIAGRWSSAFTGSEFDPASNRKRMEQLVRKVEDLLQSLTGPSSNDTGEAVTSAERLAAMLKEALAANTIGGRGDDDARWRSAADEVRQAKAAWARLGFVPDDVRQPLAQRFNQACARILAGRDGGDRRGRDGAERRESRRPPRQEKPAI